MNCKKCDGRIVPVKEVQWSQEISSLFVTTRIELMTKAHKCSYHIGCFEELFQDPFKRCLLVKKVERKENENRD